MAGRGSNCAITRQNAGGTVAAARMDVISDDANAFFNELMSFSDMMIGTGFEAARTDATALGAGARPRARATGAEAGGLWPADRPRSAAARRERSGAPAARGRLHRSVAGRVAVWRSPGDDGFELVTTLGRPARIGALAADLYPGPVSRFDLGNFAIVDLTFGTLASVTDLALVGGANALAIEAAPSVWEVLQFGIAELITRTLSAHAAAARPNWHRSYHRESGTGRCPGRRAR